MSKIVMRDPDPLLAWLRDAKDHGERRIPNRNPLDYPKEVR